MSIVGSVVECSPATRAARVRFPDDAVLKIFLLLFPVEVDAGTSIPNGKATLAGWGCNVNSKVSTD